MIRRFVAHRRATHYLVRIAGIDRVEAAANNARPQTSDTSHIIHKVT